MRKLSTLFCTVLLSSAAFAQIPNASFEIWTAHTGYDTPDSWGNTNPYTGISSTYTCEKGATGAPAGTDYLKLTTKNCGVVVPGVAVTGIISLVGTTVSVSGGFACTSRPARLTGEYQYTNTGSDNGHIIVFLSKWNTVTGKRDTVAYVDTALTGSLTSWSAFSVNLNYYSGKFPDSAMIVLCSSNLPPATATVGSSLYIDTLSFAGNVPSGVVTINNSTSPTTIFPNPASDLTNVLYYSQYSEDIAISIFDLKGRTVKRITSKTNRGENTIPLNITGYARGFYIIRIEGDQGAEEKKLIIE